MNAFIRAAQAGVHILAINGAITWLPIVHSWFTLDPDTRVRKFMRSRRGGSAYYAAVPDDFGRPDARLIAHRSPPEPGINWLHRIEGGGVLKSRPGLSEDRSAINTGNSAWGALGLAYHMRPQRIAIVGLDGTRFPYAYGGGRPHGNFAHLPALFASAMPQLRAANIAVLNGSLRSTVTCFTRTDPITALNWIGETAEPARLRYQSVAYH